MIIKDSVKYKSEQFVLEEVKIPLKNKQAIAIQNQIQNANGIFNKPNYKSAEKRLKAKKDTLKSLIKRDELLQENYGFENYKILYQNSKIINLSINLQSFGSPFEVNNYLTFDITNGKKIDEKYFTDKGKIKKLIEGKLKKQGKYISLSDTNLSSFVLNTNSKNKISGITFIISDEENYRNSGYEQFEASFTWEEVDKYISNTFKNIL